MRFWVITVPAKIIDGILFAYGVFLAVMTLICFLSVMASFLVP